MKTEISTQQIDLYDEQGFVVIDDFLDVDELSHWRRNVDEAVTARQDRKIANRDDRSGDSYYDKVFTQRLNLWMDHDGVRGLMLDDRLGKMAAELAGVDGIRIWHDQALIKEPWANPTGWHIDNPYWSFSSRQAISIWVALPLRVVPAMGDPRCRRRPDAGRLLLVPQRPARPRRRRQHDTRSAARHDLRLHARR
jgi:ectoine hydroxylase-related dioxygenase (phytanoyl-CoA dioxygenase family)